MAKYARVVAQTDLRHFRPLIARDLVKLFRAFIERFPNPQLRPDEVTVEAFHALFDACQTEYLHFIGRTSYTQPHVRFLVQEVLALAAAYMVLPTLLPSTAPVTPTGATLKPHVRPFGLLLVYLLYATQPLHALPPQEPHQQQHQHPSEEEEEGEAGATTAAVREAQRRRQETGIADITVLEFALRESTGTVDVAEAGEGQEGQDPTTISSPATAPSPKRAQSLPVVRSDVMARVDKKREARAKQWDMNALDDKDLFPRLYPLPVTVARPVMEYYLAAAGTPVSSSAPTSHTAEAERGPGSLSSGVAALLPVERFILASLHAHKAWNIVPVVDVSNSLALLTAAHAELEAPLMSLTATRGADGDVVGAGSAGGARGRGRARISAHQLFGGGGASRSQASQSTALSQSEGTIAAPVNTSVTSGSLLRNPTFQAQLEAYRALKAKLNDSAP